MRSTLAALKPSLVICRPPGCERLNVTRVPSNPEKPVPRQPAPDCWAARVFHDVPRSRETMIESVVPPYTCAPSALAAHTNGVAAAG